VGHVNVNKKLTDVSIFPLTRKQAVKNVIVYDIKLLKRSLWGGNKKCVNRAGTKNTYRNTTEQSRLRKIVDREFSFEIAQSFSYS